MNFAMEPNPDPCAFFPPIPLLTMHRLLMGRNMDSAPQPAAESGNATSAVFKWRHLAHRGQMLSKSMLRSECWVSTLVALEVCFSILQMPRRDMSLSVSWILCAFPYSLGDLIIPDSLWYRTCHESYLSAEHLSKVCQAETSCKDLTLQEGQTFLRRPWCWIFCKSVAGLTFLFALAKKAAWGSCRAIGVIFACFHLASLSSSFTILHPPSSSALLRHPPSIAFSARSAYPDIGAVGITRTRLQPGGQGAKLGLLPLKPEGKEGKEAPPTVLSGALCRFGSRALEIYLASMGCCGRQWAWPRASYAGPAFCHVAQGAVGPLTYAVELFIVLANTIEIV